MRPHSVVVTARVVANGMLVAPVGNYSNYWYNKRKSVREWKQDQREPWASGHTPKR